MTCASFTGFLVLGLFLAEAGCASRPPLAEDPALRQFRERGLQFYQAGDFAAAEREFQQGLALARQRGAAQQILIFLNNMGASRTVAGAFREALVYYEEALGLATRLGDWEKRDGTLINVANLHAQLGDAAHACQLAERILADPGSRRSRYRSQIMTALGIFRDMLQRPALTDAAFREAVALNFEQGDRLLESRARHHWGWSLLARGELEAAEQQLSRSLAIQILDRGFERGFVELAFARLRLAQDRPDEALRHADEAVARAGLSGHDPPWMAHVLRARVLLQKGDIAAARSDFRQALRWARRWRSDALPSDRLVSGAERMLRDIPGGFGDIALRTRRSEDALEALTVFEESRRSALRNVAVSSQQRRGALPAQYRTLLTQVPLLETRAVVTRNAALARQAERIREQLSRLENLHNAAVPPPAIAEPAEYLRELQQSLSPDETLWIFALLPNRSLGWALKKKSFEMRELPREEWFAGRVRCFRAFQGETSDRCADELSQKLFGEFSPEIPTNTFWTLVLDGVLAELPLAALPTPGSSGVLASASGARNEGRMYLAESHRLSIVPWAVPHSRAARPAPRKGEVSLSHFAGYGDPIYNRADIRWRSRAAAPPGLMAFWSTSAGLPSTLRLPAVELPRLAGSGREVLRSASIWEKAGARNTVLLGEEANRARLVAMLEDHPDILHLGTHVIVPGAEEPAPLLVLGLDPSSGEVQLLDAAEIASGPQAPRLVVLSGCRSMGTSLIDGKGVQSLVRAWIAGGAEAVLASHWVIPDDDGEFFVHFYRALAGSTEEEPMRRRLATAIQRAQRAVMAAGGWRRDPRHWAAWQATVRE